MNEQQKNDAVTDAAENNEAVPVDPGRKKKRIKYFFMGNRVFKTRESKTHVRNSTGRVLFAALAILVEVGWIVLEAIRLNAAVPLLENITRLLALVLVMWIYSQDKTPSMKMPWIILILLAPVLGIMLYLLVGLSGTTSRMRQRYRNIDEQLMPRLKQDSEAAGALRRKDAGTANISGYLERLGFPVYDNSRITYYATAEEGLEAQKEALRAARHFIFMEYHAIEDAEAWAGLCGILAAKASEGVTVRIFYDDAGSTTFISHDFVDKMESLGIACRVFNPIGPVLNMFLNNRDHRKITVIDGKVGFTGGYNLANEYFNLTHPYGHWKDSGVRITGEAVQTLTVLFLEMWNAISAQDLDDTNFDRFLPEVKPEEKPTGFIQPYADSPIDDVQVGEDVYLHIINNARSYVWFMTPYLIITDEMIRALTLAAQRGVDVRIITPGIPDKKMVYNVTRSYYTPLLKDGVRIYEYTPGFCHAKMCISDDVLATCGTINLDYRSLYHHFENGCLFAYCEAVQDVRRDFEETFPKCLDVYEASKNRLSWNEIKQIDEAAKQAGVSRAKRREARKQWDRMWYEKGHGVKLSIWRAVLRMFAELM